MKQRKNSNRLWQRHRKSNLSLTQNKNERQNLSMRIYQWYKGMASKGHNWGMTTYPGSICNTCFEELNLQNQTETIQRSRLLDELRHHSHSNQRLRNKYMLQKLKKIRKQESSHELPRKLQIQAGFNYLILTITEGTKSSIWTVIIWKKIELSDGQ